MLAGACSVTARWLKEAAWLMQFRSAEAKKHKQAPKQQPEQDQDSKSHAEQLRAMPLIEGKRRSANLEEEAHGSSSEQGSSSGFRGADTQTHE